MARIVLNKREHTIKVVNRKDNIRLKRQLANITLKQSGHKGDKGDKGNDGDKGDAGVGLPTGGNDGQVLSKLGSENYAFQWLTPTFTGDKYAALEFTVSSEVAFTHGLNKYPAVSVIDSAGDEVVGSVEFVGTNSIIVKFAAPFSGRITCN